MPSRTNAIPYPHPAFTEDDVKTWLGYFFSLKIGPNSPKIPNFVNRWTGDGKRLFTASYEDLVEMFDDEDRARELYSAVNWSTPHGKYQNPWFYVLLTIRIIGMARLSYLATSKVFDTLLTTVLKQYGYRSDHPVSPISKFNSSSDEFESECIFPGFGAFVFHATADAADYSMSDFILPIQLAALYIAIWGIAVLFAGPGEFQEDVPSRFTFYNYPDPSFVKTLRWGFGLAKAAISSSG